MYARDYTKTPVSQKAFEEAFARHAQLSRSAQSSETPAKPPSLPDTQTTADNNHAAKTLMLCILCQTMPVEEALLLLLLLGV